VTIPSSAKPKPLDLPNVGVPAVDPRTGLFSSEELQRQQRVANYINSGGRIIPCSCSSSSNVYTLTPNGSGNEDGAAPLIEGYRFGDMYLFVADASATNSVTGSVVPKTGTLSTLKFYINGGASQAGNGDITAGRVYIGVYVYSLDTNNGGIVIRHP
jgi:hypothetical protein